MSDVYNITKEDEKLVMKFEEMQGYAQQCTKLVSAMEVIIESMEEILNSYIKGESGDDVMYYGQGCNNVRGYVVGYTNHLVKITEYLMMCKSFIDICVSTVLQEDERLLALVQATVKFYVDEGSKNGSKEIT